MPPTSSEDVLVVEDAALRGEQRDAVRLAAVERVVEGDDSRLQPVLPPVLVDERLQRVELAGLHEVGGVGCRRVAEDQIGRVAGGEGGRDRLAEVLVAVVGHLDVDTRVSILERLHRGLDGRVVLFVRDPRERHGGRFEGWHGRRTRRGHARRGRARRATLAAATLAGAAVTLGAAEGDGEAWLEQAAIATVRMSAPAIPGARLNLGTCNPPRGVQRDAWMAHDVAGGSLLLDGVAAIT